MKRDAIRTRPYYAPGGASTCFYDLTTGADPSLAGDVDLYAKLAEGRGAVLELGAGTGRIAIALAQRGFDVVGLDIAPAMLAQAEAKRAALPPDVARRLAFIRGDLTSLALGRTFGAIFATYFTLAHVPPATGWKRAFAGIARHLAPGGIAGLHLPIAERMAAPPPPPDRPVMHLAIGDGRTLTIFVARQIMADTVVGWTCRSTMSSPPRQAMSKVAVASNSAITPPIRRRSRRGRGSGRRPIRSRSAHRAISTCSNEVEGKIGAIDGD